MSALQDLETMAEMVGFKYASLSVDVESKEVTLQCEDRDGTTLTVQSPTIDSAMVAMMDRLHQIAGAGDSE